MKLAYLITAEDLSGKYRKLNNQPTGNKDIGASLRAIVGRFLRLQQERAEADAQSDLISDDEVAARTAAYSHIYWETVEVLD